MKGQSQPAVWLSLSLAVLLLAGCSARGWRHPAPETDARSLVAAAIAARGGPVSALTRNRVSAKVDRVYPGLWVWDMEVRAKEFLRWRLIVAGADQTYIYDHGSVRRFLGSAELTDSAGDLPEITSIARYLAIVDLDALLKRSDVRLERISPQEFEPGAAFAIRVSIEGTTEPYTLFFDERFLAVGASGPFVVDGSGATRMTLERSGFRDFSGVLLPEREIFLIDGHEFVDARIDSWSVVR